MSRARLAGLMLLASALAPALAHAKAIEDVTIGADASDILINVVSDEPLTAPTVRTYRGSVRLRFYDAKDPTQLKLAGDGGALREILVGQGSDQSAALTLVLGDKTRLAPTDVRIEMKGETIVLRIARGLLPPLREEAPQGKPAPVAPAPSPLAAPEAAPPAAPPMAATEPAPTQKPPFALGAKKAPAPQEKPDVKLTPNDAKSSPMPLLLTLTALLALAYGGLRLFMMKKKGLVAEIPAIDVVAQRRLGPRHQLVVVRAFDRDYLLSIQGGQTTVVARSSRRTVPSGSVPATAASPLADQLLAPSMALVGRSPVPAAARDRDRDFDEDDEATFGGELFRHALEQRERARENTSGMRLEAARAEARAEIARMEAARRESEPVRGIAEPVRGIAEPVRGISERALAERASEPARGHTELLRMGSSDNDNDNDELRDHGEQQDEVTDSTPPSADGISESVTGLLRLRRKSGR